MKKLALWCLTPYAPYALPRDPICPRCHMPCGFISMVPMADAEIVKLQAEGYAYMQ